MLSDEFETKLALMESIGIILLNELLDESKRNELEKTVMDIKDEIMNTYNPVNIINESPKEA